MKVVIFFAALLVPTLVHGATAVTLKEAIDLALGGNHLLLAATHERAASARDVPMLRSRYLPRVRLEETFTGTNSPPAVFMMKLDQGRFSSKDFEPASLNNPSGYHNFMTGLFVEQLLFDLPVTRAIEVAEHEDRGRGYRLEGRRQETALKVYEAYLEVRKCRTLLVVAEQGVIGAREHLRLARVRNESGVGLKSDELRAGSYLAEMDQRLISSRNDLLLARLRLGQEAGLKPGSALDANEEPLYPVVVPADEELARQALENRPDLKEQEAGMAGAEAGISMAKAAYLPTAYASAGYRLNGKDHPFGRDNDAWQVGVSMRWDLFDGLKREHALGKARAMKTAVEEVVEQYRDEVLLQVTEQSLRRREAEQRMEVSLKALQQAEEGLRLVSRRFENSLATMVELLDAETALIRSRSLVVENESGFVLATARVLAAAGILLKEVGK